MLIRSMFEQLACCIHLYVFFLSLKNLFSSSSTAFRQICIYRAPLSSFLDKSQRNLDPSSFLEFVSITSRSIEKLSIWPIDSRQNLDPLRYFCRQQIHICQDLVLDKSRQLLNPSSCVFLYIPEAQSGFHFLTSLSTENIFLSLQTLSSHSNLLTHCIFSLDLALLLW